MAALGSEIRVAAVQAAPVFLDREATVDKAVALVREAADAGADLIGFPEGFIPGHPGWVELLPPDRRALELSKRLFQNAVEVPSAATEAVAEAGAERGIAAVVGICERVPRSTGTLFNTQLFIDPSGNVGEKHQKFVPTVGERLVHGPGTTGSVNALALDEEITVSGLICGENSNPLAQYATARSYPTVHVASWPQHFSRELRMQPVIELVSRGLAYSLKVFVMNAVTRIGEEMIEAYGDEENIPFLRSDDARGRASIVAPSGEIIAEADGFGEQLVLADIDPADVIIPKFVHDTAGHYNRPELFSHLFAPQTITS
jgi:nitrilase